MPNGPLREPFVAVHGARRRTTSGPRTASSAPRPYIGYMLASQWHTRQPQSLEQLAAISWCRSHAERMAGAALINHGGTVIYQHVRVARPPSISIHPAFSLPLPPRPRFSREERSTERRTGALRGKSIPELPPPRALPSLSATHRPAVSVDRGWVGFGWV